MARPVVPAPGTAVVGESGTPAPARAPTARDVAEARRRARDWGRFTRNFVVQGTAAEWALCWMAALRRRLREIDGRPHLVFFLHDEVMVHSPVDDGRPGGRRRCATPASRRVGCCSARTPVEFALDVSTVDSYDQAS